METSYQNRPHPSLPHVLPHLEGSGLYSTVEERDVITLGHGLSIYSDSELVSVHAWCTVVWFIFVLVFIISTEIYFGFCGW